MYIHDDSRCASCLVSSKSSALRVSSLRSFVILVQSHGAAPDRLESFSRGGDCRMDHSSARGDVRYPSCS